MMAQPTIHEKGSIRFSELQGKGEGREDFDLRFSEVLNRQKQETSSDEK